MKKANKIYIMCLIIIISGVIILWKNLHNDRMSTCMKTVKTPYYEMIDGKIFCKTRDDFWIDINLENK